MTDDEKARFLHQQMHEKHKGHDDMHAAMLLILIGKINNLIKLINR